MNGASGSAQRKAELYESFFDATPDLPVSREVIDALLIARARGEPDPAQGPRLRPDITFMCLTSETEVAPDEIERRRLVYNAEVVRQNDEPDEEPETRPDPLKGRIGAIGKLLAQQSPDGPDRTTGKPVWVLFDTGGMRQRRGFRLLVLREFLWHKHRNVWVTTQTPDRHLPLYQALNAADWIGRLPHQGKRLTVSNGRLLLLIEQHPEKTDREVAVILGKKGEKVSYSTVRRIRRDFLT